MAVVAGDADGLDVCTIVGRALVGIVVGYRLGFLVAYGILVGVEVFVVGADVVGLKVCSNVGAFVGPAVLGEQSLFGVEVFVVGADVVGQKDCSNVGAFVGPAVLGEQSLSIFMLILTLLLRPPPPPTTLVSRMPKSPLR